VLSLRGRPKRTPRCLAASRPAPVRSRIKSRSNSAYCEEPQYAEFERELVRARTSEGRARAKANGVKLGRKFKLTPHQRKEALARRDRGETLMDIARTYNVSHSTISRLSALVGRSESERLWRSGYLPPPAR
jgi:hypothetical protein